MYEVVERKKTKNKTWKGERKKKENTKKFSFPYLH